MLFSCEIARLFGWKSWPLGQRPANNQSGL
jgi:hypothetical protein